MWEIIIAESLLVSCLKKWTILETVFTIQIWFDET